MKEGETDRLIPPPFAAMALALTVQDWNHLGIDPDGQRYHELSDDELQELLIERATSLLLVRIVAILINPKDFRDLSSSTICRTILMEEKPWEHYAPGVTIEFIHQLEKYVTTILNGYKNTPYHCNEHAFHVLLSVNKLIDMLIQTSPIKVKTFGLRHDPLALFAMVFAALIHDVQHKGVPNRQLVNENDPFAIMYNDQSVAEQRSLFIAFEQFLKPEYKLLRTVIFQKQRLEIETPDYRKFRKIVIDLVLNTDIASPERTQIAKSKWKEAFGDTFESIERKLKHHLNGTVPANTCNGGDDDDSVSDSETPDSSVNGDENNNDDEEEDGGMFAAYQNSMSTNSQNVGNSSHNFDPSMSVSNSSNMNYDIPEERALLDDAVPPSPNPSIMQEYGYGNAKPTVGMKNNSNNQFPQSPRIDLSAIQEYGYGNAKPTVGMRQQQQQQQNQRGGGRTAMSKHHSMPLGRRGSIQLLQSDEHYAAKFQRRMSSYGNPIAARRASGFRKRLGIRRSMDLSGEAIDAYTRSGTSRNPAVLDDELDELKAIVVMETIMTAADVAHNLQGWDQMVNWSGRLYLELRKAYIEKRGVDPEQSWFENQIGFLESYLLPLARRLEDTGVFGEYNGQIFANTVEQNRDRWMTDGQNVTDTIIARGEEIYNDIWLAEVRAAAKNKMNNKNNNNNNTVVVVQRGHRSNFRSQNIAILATIIMAILMQIIMVQIIMIEEEEK